MIGSQDLMIGLVIALFFFGAKRLPEIARSIGKSMQEFKKGVSSDAGEQDAANSSRPPSAIPATATSSAIRTCLGCHAPIEPNWKHCPRCGTAAEESGTSSAPVA